MPRPIKLRTIGYIPTVKNFIPTGTEECQGITCNSLTTVEIEAIRLKDHLGLDQIECAEYMNVSRPTFARILVSARTKIADSLINGKGISINEDANTEFIPHGRGRGQGRGRGRGPGNGLGRNTK
ncbi:MAG: DUF134 domain-containing protein [Peptostreptococcaceae bacterium]|nr:DUF134 domain-containing protein [Peptostreptococcaceae bacterium]